MKKLVRYLSVLPAIIMLCIIFRFSAQDGPSSGSLSYKLCHWMISLADRIFSTGLSDSQIVEQALSIQLVVRKLAHMTEYFILTLCFYLPLRVLISNKEYADNRSFLSKRVLPAFLLSIVSAAADEFHQSFVPGRCGTPVDVLVDSAGSILACAVLFLWHRHIRKKRQN